VSAGNSPNKFVSTFGVSAILRPGADPAKVEKILWEELRRLQSEPVPARDFQKVRNNAFATHVRGLTDMENVATHLAWYQMFGDYRIYLRWAESLDAVTPVQVQDAAKRYFTRQNAVIGQLLPATGASL